VSAPSTLSAATTRRDLEAALADELGSPSEARWLTEEVLGPSRRPGQAGPALSAAALSTLADLAARRRAGEPLQYVLGHWAFRTLELDVDPRVLIPRPETEQLVDVALGVLAEVAGERPDPLVVDLGTGSGAIALAVAVEALPERPQLRVWAGDVSPGALAVAERNRELVGARHPGAAERVVLRSGDWWRALPEGLRGRVDLGLANPPYVAVDEWDALDREVRREPRLALVAETASDGTPGMAAVEAVVAGAVDWLAPGGALVVELAPDQAGPASALARRAGFAAVDVRPDLAGRPRVLVARRSPT